MKLMVLDGNSLVNRAFFGIKLLTTKDGRYTNAIYGFQNILLNLLAAHQPDAVAIAWDERAPTFRHNAYDGYKATRHGMPEELAQQMPVLKELLDDLGFVQVSRAGWEADDILGTLAAACEAQGGTTLLATGDRDSLQLVDDATTVLLATNRETIPMDPAAIREKYGVDPVQLIDVKSLMGDSSDSIPGVPGIGEKTALALVQKFGSLQAVYDHLADPALNLLKLARDCLFVSEDHLSRMFSRRTGTRLTHFIESRRVEVARRLIDCDPNVTNARLAELVGYPPDGRYFSRVFRKQFGMTPGEYREKMRDQPADRQ